MSDIKKVLTDEIRRLAKKEIKIATDPLNAKIVALKKQVAELTKALNLSQKEIKEKPKAALPQSTETSVKVRLSAAGIKKIREKLNLTQDAVASILGVSKAAYCTWEQGRKIPSRKTKMKIAALRKISPAQAKKIINEMGIKQGVPRKSKNATPKIEVEQQSETQAS